jgi:hypothetical protein
MTYNPVDVARQFLFVREAQSLGQNKGQRVEAMQRWCGGTPGQSWCAYFVTMVLDICFQGEAPIPRLGAVEDIHQLAIKNKWIVATPEPGDLVLSVNSANHAHHIGICTAITASVLTTIAGNTDATGASSNGDRVAEHPVAAAGKVYVRYPRPT